MDTRSRRLIRLWPAFLLTLVLIALGALTFIGLQKAETNLAGIVAPRANGPVVGQPQGGSAALQPTAAMSRGFNEQYSSPALIPNLAPSANSASQADASPTGASTGQEPRTDRQPPPHLQPNPFISTKDDHLSTFALDVDTGSYTAARNYIMAGTLPPMDTIRVEEFVNYFNYDYPVPEDKAFGIHVDSATSPFAAPGAQTQIVRVGIQGQRISDAQRKDAVLTFVIDVSGSMAEPNRLPLVKEALRLLVNELRPTDQVGIVVYGSDARLVLEHTSAAERDRILQAIDGLQNEGSTNAEAGLQMGYKLASKYLKPDAINRIILCSDGVANVGATSPEEIRKSIQNYAKQGIMLSTVGFGMGDYNDHLMEQLADDGDGSYAYVDTVQAAKRIFVQNLTGTLQTIAKDAKVQVDFNPNVVSRYRLLGYENRDVADENFRNDAVDAGEIGAGHTVTVLYEVEMTGQGSGPALTVQMRYADPKSGQVQEIQQPYGAANAVQDFAATKPRFQLAVAAAAFAEQLRTYAPPTDAGATQVDVFAIAQRIAPQLANDQDVQEFLQIVSQAQTLRQTRP